MTSVEFLAANLNRSPVVELIHQNAPTPLGRVSYIGTTADVSTHWAVILDGLTRHATQNATSLLGTIVVSTGSNSTEVYALCSSRQFADPAATTAATAFLALCTTYGALVVLDKLREIAARDPNNILPRYGGWLEVVPATGRPKRPWSWSHAVEILTAELA